LTDFASDDGNSVVRRSPSLERIRFDLTAMTQPEANATAFRLREGDVIVVE
jgi:hypothetical protein